jgi:hypothetical protein
LPGGLTAIGPFWAENSLIAFSETPGTRLAAVGILIMRLKILLAALFALAAQPAFAVNFCYVTEFPLQVDGSVQVALTPPLVDQTAITVSAASAQSAAFGPGTGMARISCDTTVSAAFGSNPTATTSNMRLPANVPEYFRVRPGQRAAFITNQ